MNLRRKLCRSLPRSALSQTQYVASEASLYTHLHLERSSGWQITPSHSPCLVPAVKKPRTSTASVRLLLAGCTTWCPIGSRPCSMQVLTHDSQHDSTCETPGTGLHCPERHSGLHKSSFVLIFSIVLNCGAAIHNFCGIPIPVAILHRLWKLQNKCRVWR